MLKIASTLGALVLLATPALADMCPSMKKEKAEQAVKLIPQGSKMVIFCPHCGDNGYLFAIHVVDAVVDVDLVDPNAYKVTVNKDTVKPQNIDLGYTYVPSGPKKQYMNLGALVKCWEDVSGDASDYDFKVLPDNLIPRGPVLPPDRKQD
jgi:hypothetical protein